MVSGQPLSCFFRTDDSRVPVYPLYNVKGQHGELEINRYPRAGDPNPEVRVGIVSVEGGEVAWVDFNSETDQYFGTPFWRPDGSGLLVQWMPREQNNLKLYDVNPVTGVKREIYNEEQPTWVNWITSLHWVKDGFMMIRDFDGWEQIYLHNSDGSLRQKLTSGRKWDTEIVRIDEKNPAGGILFRRERSRHGMFLQMSGLTGKRQQQIDVRGNTIIKIFACHRTIVIS